MYGYSTNNPYLDGDIIDKQYKERMREQERIAIKAIIKAKKVAIKMQGTELTQTLNTKKTEMQNFASQTVALNLKEGLVGKAAEAAATSLKTSKFQPDLKSPIK